MLATDPTFIATLDQAAILCNDMLAMREAMLVLYRKFATNSRLVASRRHCVDGTIRIMFYEAGCTGFSIKYILWILPVKPRPHAHPQVHFAQTNKAFLLQSERYQPFPTPTTPCTKNNGFSWLRRKGTKKALKRQGRGWH
ncbi:hypothetical protein JMJ35_007067 [Cladonia borealis]|uniref:Uncharacterized protein n=1 Tax=Cladonia borealis TaxID=184061 RepID=A0AA39QYV0_9LECA|nr:hypothetical protein JMJ35_007067 [Cladonia borealis]